MLKKVSSIIVNIILVCSVLLFVMALIQTVMNSDSPNDTFLLGYKPVYVVSGSMEPEMKVGGIAIVKKASYDDVSVDDIIMYEVDEKLITHRVIEITDDGIRTKGDGNDVQDAYLLTEENVKGVVVAVWNWPAKLKELWESPSGKTKIVIITAVVLMAIIILGVIVALKKASKQEQKREKVGVPRHAVSQEEADETQYLNLT